MITRTEYRASQSDGRAVRPLIIEIINGMTVDYRALDIPALEGYLDTLDRTA